MKKQENPNIQAIEEVLGRIPGHSEINAAKIREAEKVLERLREKHGPTRKFTASKGWKGTAMTCRVVRPDEALDESAIGFE